MLLELLVVGSIPTLERGSSMVEQKQAKPLNAKL